MKKRILPVFLILIMTYVLVLPICAAVGEASIQPVSLPEIVNVGSACVYNIENARYIYDLDADRIVYPTSTVKLMTAILTVEKYGGDLSHEITVMPEALIGVKGNRILLKRNEILTVEQLLYALVCGGANDAANVLAIDIGGSVEGFVEMMNQKARVLGARNTYYTNPTGLHDDNMVTTAKDTALIASYAYGLSPICEMATAEKFVIPAVEGKTSQHTIDNRNYYYSSTVEYKYIWRVAPTPRGLNAGSTKEGGYCVVTTIARDGLTYVVVVMNATRDEDTIYSYTEAAKLAKWALGAYDYTKVLTTSDMICEIPVKLSSKVDYVTLFPSKTVELFLPTDIDLENDLEMTWTLNRDSFIAPVSEGEVAGTLSLSYNGTSLGTYDLITRNGVNRDNILYLFDLAGDVIESRPFRMIAAVAVAAFICYFGVLVFMTVKSNRRKR